MHETFYDRTPATDLDLHQIESLAPGCLCGVNLKFKISNLKSIDDFPMGRMLRIWDNFPEVGKF